ncbi:hypothetical protein F5X68DRAFT_80475 [Plectosphaerella plurivora]|uniref:C3H1-type domain-containing protein n=1 Tax=Plectosphaerella plurivora TaxID=936078 RepID=A0A9P9AB97_9PEZI|nr:hypothetical protein F5X68DRAFT_80475 [Plectosphaerella plurivora]
MTNIQLQLNGLKQDWTSCQREDDKKQALITELFALIQDLEIRLTTLQLDLCDSKELGHARQTQLASVRREVEALKFVQAQHAFASVVIDGDCTPFRDELVQQGLDGGMRAATLLRQAVEEDLRSSVSDAAHHLQVIVRVYANVKGLAATYVRAGILSDPAILDDFIRGFNMYDAMCDFVDAGNGKECADEKVKAVFKQSLNDVHCRQILFGGAGDSGYARTLGPCAQDEAPRGKITLLEGSAFAYELVEIRDKFRVTPIHTVLRTQKLSTVKRKASLTPPSTPVDGYVTAARKSSASPPPVVIPAIAPAPRPTPSSSSAVVLRNKHGQRVDRPLEYRQEDFHTLRPQKLCNSFHLLDRCQFLDLKGQCAHRHGKKLSPRQLEALRAVARLSPCHSGGIKCGDADCLSGHQCVFRGCTGSDCKFPNTMHNVDTRVVA